ncbi:unnamed protein product, partial [Merluccius merluccius]
MDIYALNETSVLAEWTGSAGDPGNGSLDPAGNTWGDRRAAAAPPPPPHHREDPTLRILLYALIFLLSAVGNLLIIVVLALNKRMRTVTNCFLLSLALSDLMMAVFCMPFTLIPNVLEDFIFGAAMCKIVAYFMGISVSISTFSLVAIAIERYSAICNPLKSRVWQTRSHAYRVIAATWVLAFVVMTPYPIVTHLDTHQRDNTTVHQCRHMWPHVRAEQTWCILLMLVLFLIPGVVMIVAYGLISRELYRGIQFETGQNREATGVRNGLTSSTSTGAVVATGSDDGDGCYVHVAPARPHAAPVEMSTLTAAASAPRPPETGGASAQQHVGGQAGGQEARDPHAGGDRGTVLHLLDAAVLRQHVARLRQRGGGAGARGPAHLLHPAAGLHLGLRQPGHLLLHEHALPQGADRHLLLLHRAVPTTPPARPRAAGHRGGRHGDRGVHVEVQLHDGQHYGHLL